MFWKSFLLFFFLLLSFKNSFTQNRKIDSLERKLVNYKKDDTIRAEMMHSLGMQLLYSNPKKTFQLSKELSILGQKLNNINTQYASIELEGAYYFASLKLDSATILYHKMNDFGKTNKLLKPIFAAQSNLASINLMRGNTKECIKIYIELLEEPLVQNSNFDIKGKVLVNLANAYNVTGDRVLALKIALQALELNEKYGDKFSVSATNYLIGTIYGTTAQFKEALQYHQSFARIQLELKNWSTACSALIAVANDFKQLNKTDSAFYYYNSALKIAKDYELLAQQSKIEMNFSSFTNIVIKQEEEVDNLLMLKKKYEENSLQQDLGLVLCKLAIGYAKVSTTFLQKKGLDKKQANTLAINYLDKSMEIATTSNNYGLKEETLRYTSMYYEIQQDYVKAFSIYQKYIVLRDSALNESKQLEIAKLNLQFSFNKKEDSLKLIQAATDAKLQKQFFLNKTQEQNILLQNNQLLLNKNTIIANEQQLSLLNKDKELQHLQYLKSQADLQTEQLLKGEKEVQLTLVQKEKLLETAKVKNLFQENEFNKLKRKQIIGYGVTSLLALMFGILYIVNRNKNKQAQLKAELAREKAEQQTKEAEFQKSLTDVSLSALRSQMNPHFIFNCLNSIKLYTAQNDTVAAVNYLTKFSKLIRLALENSRSDTVSLSNEIKSLELYIQLEAMRFKDKLKYTIQVDKNVDIDFIEIPPMLLQPYVENSIWHGLMHQENGGNIDIIMKNNDANDALIITIKDDGVGREKAAQLSSKSATKHKSFGTKVTSERLELINKLFKTEANVTTEDVLKNNQVVGTLVTINIPY